MTHVLELSSLECSRNTSPRSSVELQTSDCEADVESNLSVVSGEDEEQLNASQKLFSLAKWTCIPTAPEKIYVNDDEEDCEGKLSPVRTLTFLGCILVVCILLLSLIFLPSGGLPCCRTEATPQKNDAYESIFDGYELCSEPFTSDTSNIVVIGLKKDKRCVPYIVSTNTSYMQRLNKSSVSTFKVLSQDDTLYFIWKNGHIHTYKSSLSKRSAKDKWNLFQQTKSPVSTHIIGSIVIPDINHDHKADILSLCTDEKRTYFLVICGRTLEPRKNLIFPSGITYVTPSFLSIHVSGNTTYVIFTARDVALDSVCLFYLDLDFTSHLSGQKHNFDWQSARNDLEWRVHVKNVFSMIDGSVNIVQHDLTRDGVADIVCVSVESVLVVLDGSTWLIAHSQKIISHVVRYVCKPNSKRQNTREFG